MSHESGETCIDRAVGVRAQMDSACSTTGMPEKKLYNLSNFMVESLI